MSMKAMYDLRDMLCKELDEIAHKGELGAGDLDIAHKLVSTIKNIDKIDLLLPRRRLFPAQVFPRQLRRRQLLRTAWHPLCARPL